MMLFHKFRLRVPPHQPVPFRGRAILADRRCVAGPLWQQRIGSFLDRLQACGNLSINAIPVRAVLVYLARELRELADHCSDLFHAPSLVRGQV